MSLEVLPMLKETKEEHRNDSILHHHRLWHLFCMRNLPGKKQHKLIFSLVDSDQVHESFVIPAGVDSFRWKDWFLRVNEHLQHHGFKDDSTTRGHLKHLLVLEKVVKIPLSDCPGIVVL